MMRRTIDLDHAGSEAPWMTVPEVAELCRTTPSAVYQWRWLSQGPKAIKLGRRLLFRRTDVEAWLAAHSD